jgi:hypothetical protein
VTFEDRVTAVRALTADRLTDRQAGFLVTVMLHSGVCLGRHYCAYANLSYGKKTHAFFQDLIARRFVAIHPCGHGRARLYRVRYKPLWAAIGQPDNRNRKFTSLPRAIERLMLLDAILECRDTRWLAIEDEKVAYFRDTLRVPESALPVLVFRSGESSTSRYFPDKLPIAAQQADGEHVFLYLVTRWTPVDFRVFLERHADLLRSLRSWVIRLLAPQHFLKAIGAYHSAFREHLATPLRPAVAKELEWYFAARAGGPPDNSERFDYAADAFRSARFRVLFQRWREHGDSVLGGAVSPALADAIERGDGRFEGHELPRRYVHLSKLVGTA